MKEGAVEVRVDKSSFTFSAKQIAFIPPGQIHAIQGILPNSSYDAFVFSLDLLSLPDSHFFEKELITPLRSGQMRFPYILRPSDAPYQIVSEALDRICSICKDDPLYKRVIFTSMIQLFTAMMDHLVPGSSLSLKKSNESLKICLQYMNEHYAEHLTLQEISDQVHLHPNYLCALFRAQTGLTPHRYLTRLRLEKACALMEQGCTVREAAEAVGIPPENFSRLFKRHLGKTPGACRKAPILP